MLFLSSSLVVVFFLCLWERDQMLHWIGPVSWKWSVYLQDWSCMCNSTQLITQLSSTMYNTASLLHTAYKVYFTLHIKHAAHWTYQWLVQSDMSQAVQQFSSASVDMLSSGPIKAHKYTISWTKCHNAINSANIRRTRTKSAVNLLQTHHEHVFNNDSLCTQTIFVDNMLVTGSQQVRLLELAKCTEVQQVKSFQWRYAKYWQLYYDSKQTSTTSIVCTCLSVYGRYLLTMLNSFYV